MNSPHSSAGTSTVVTGSEGEALAAEYLRALGYTILAMNVRCGRGEVDIVARDVEDDTLVFAEVKTRRKFSEDFRPELNLTPRKLSAMVRAAYSWMIANEYDGAWRLDLVCVAEKNVTDHFRELEWEEEEGD